MRKDIGEAVFNALPRIPYPLTVLSFNVIGEALKQAFAPKEPDMKTKVLSERSEKRV